LSTVNPSFARLSADYPKLKMSHWEASIEWRWQDLLRGTDRVLIARPEAAGLELPRGNLESSA
jgi:hypothetical protein